MRRRELFPSPVFFNQPSGQEALRAALRTSILNEAGDARGWRSPSDLFTRPEGSYKELYRFVVENFQAALRLQAGDRSFVAPFDIRGGAWAEVIRPGEYRAPRRYADAHWAGLYVIDAGDQPAGALPAGSLSFLDPRGAVKGDDPLSLFSTHHELAPADGLLLLFPGWLQHHSHPYAGTRPRVSIWFTLTLS
ncbi:MAG: hypothetical protein ACI8S6_000008 [Myxococcota bacterium]|jgi:hypothetical protein